MVVRSSKGNSQEDYIVDAVEVVSFGHSFFFRSSERPKSFLVPVGDYEVLELKETRMVLKNVATERSIKIGGGREAPPRPHRESALPEIREELPEESRERSERPAPERSASPDRSERRRDKRGRRRRGGRDRGERQEAYPQEARERPQEEAPLPSEEPVSQQEEVKAPSYISKLFPPPPTLIKDTIGRYKTAEAPSGEEFFESEEKISIEETVFEQPQTEKNPEADDESFDEE